MDIRQIEAALADPVALLGWFNAARATDARAQGYAANQPAEVERFEAAVDALRRAQDGARSAIAVLEQRGPEIRRDLQAAEEAHEMLEAMPRVTAAQLLEQSNQARRARSLRVELADIEQAADAARADLERALSAARLAGSGVAALKGYIAGADVLLGRLENVA